MKEALSDVRQCLWGLFAFLRCERQVVRYYRRTVLSFAKSAV